MSNPKKQHYVPQVYLQNFKDDDGYIYIYDIEKDQFRRQTPQNAGYNKHFYTVEIDGEKDYFIEQFLSHHVDSKYSDVIKKIENGEDLALEDKQNLALIIAFQHLRTPSQRENYNNMVDSAVKQINKIMFSYKKQLNAKIGVTDEEYELLKNTIENENYSVIAPKEHSLALMLDFAEEMANMLLNHNIAILECGKNTQFITSDNPYCMIKEKWSNQWEGYGVINTIKFFPITPKFGVILKDPGNKVIYLKPNTRQVRNLNLLVASWAQRNIFAKNKVLLESIVKAHKKKTL